MDKNLGEFHQNIGYQKALKRNQQSIIDWRKNQ